MFHRIGAVVDVMGEGTAGHAQGCVRTSGPDASVEGVPRQRDAAGAGPIVSNIRVRDGLAAKLGCTGPARRPEV